MKNHALTALFFTISLLGTPSAFGADIFVMTAAGPELSKVQASEITDMVMRAVRRMPEHALVPTKDLATFTLRPTVTNRGDDLVLRVEKLKNGDVVSMSEEKIGAINAFRDQAMNATEAALLTDRLGTGADFVNVTLDPRMVNVDGSPTTPPREPALVQSGRDPDSVSGATSSPADVASNPASTPASDAGGTQTYESAGDVRAPSPLFQRRDRTGTYQVAMGPSVGLGLSPGQLMYDLNLGYSHPINERFSVKGFGDLNLTLGENAARFLNFAVAGEYYPTLAEFYGSRPYLDASAGFGFARDNNTESANAPALGTGAGFRFAANEVNMDVSLHYTLLTARIADQFPSVVGLRAALNF